MADVKGYTLPGHSEPYYYADSKVRSYGYGGEIPDFFKVKTDAEMYTKLDEMLAKMPVGSARNVYFTHEGTHVVNGVATLGGQGYLFGVLSKQLSTDSGDYAHLELYSYLGRRYQIDKVLTWGAVEFFNPAMGIGVEYRTAERCNGAAVYAKRIKLALDVIDATNGMVETVIPHNISGFSFAVRCNCIKSGYVLPYIKDNGGFTFIAIVDSANIAIRTYKAEWSESYWEIDLYYTKS